MLRRDLKGPSKRQKSLKESVTVNVHDGEHESDTSKTLNQSSKVTEGDLSNDQNPKAVAERLLELPSNDDRCNCQSGMSDDDDPFSWDVERVVQYFNSFISSPTFENALRSHEIAGWILLWEVSSKDLKEELLVEDVAQQDIIWNSILELRQMSKGYREWTEMHTS